MSKNYVSSFLTNLDSKLKIAKELFKYFQENHKLTSMTNQKNIYKNLQECDGKFEDEKRLLRNQNIDKTKCCDPITGDFNTGVYVKKALSNPLTSYIRQPLQVEFEKRTKAPLGKANAFNNDSSLLFVGALRKRDKYHVREVLHQFDRNPQRENVLSALSHINSIRRLIQQKFDFNILYIYQCLQMLDSNPKTGKISLDKIIEVIRKRFGIPICAEKCTILIDYYEYYDNEGNVDYMKFLGLLNHLIPLPEVGRLCDSDYIVKRDDFIKYSHNKYENNEQELEITKRISKGNDDCHLGEETTAKDLIMPAFSSWYDLSHRDYLLPRSKNEIRRIFTNAGFDLKDDCLFYDLFDRAKYLTVSSEENKVCVQAFHSALKHERNLCLSSCQNNGNEIESNLHNSNV